MIYDETFLYSPVLRQKKGERDGVNSLAPDIADRIRPCWVIPPPKERDPEKQRLLTKDEIVYGTGRSIASCWPVRQAYLDPRFLFADFGETESVDWLPRMFQVARDNNARVIPVGSLTQILSSNGVAFKTAIDRDAKTKFSLRVESGEIDRDLNERVRAAMSVLGLSPDQCSVMADFCDADFSDPDVVSVIAQATLEALQEAGRWRHVIFQGTNYPEKNPAEPSNSFAVPRNEWLAWKRAIRFDQNTSEHFIFGDYAADCARFNFRAGGGGRPIRHYRYTTPDSWLVVRANDEGKDGDVMKTVSSMILASGKFAGRTFSSGDDYIFLTAKGWDGPGGPSTWREVNTNHHITRVVRDIGGVKGLVFEDVRVSALLEQRELF